MSEEDPTLLCCPYCIGMLTMIVDDDEAFVVPAACRHCGMDPRKDALIEVPLSRRGAMPKRARPGCGSEIWSLASHCPSCHVRVSTVDAAAKKKAAKKPAAKKAAAKKPAAKKPAAKKPAAKKPAAKKPALKQRVGR
jgi:hypothetical protein